jgi:hypothetical protein
MKDKNQIRQEHSSSILDLSLPLDKQDKTYRGLSYNIWKGLMIGAIVSLFWNNSAGLLLLGFTTQPFGLIIYVSDALLAAMLILAIIGMRATTSSRKPFSTLWCIFWGSTIYWGVLWAV